MTEIQTFAPEGTVYPIDVNARSTWVAYTDQHARQIVSALITGGLPFTVVYRRTEDADAVPTPVKIERWTITKGVKS